MMYEVTLQEQRIVLDDDGSYIGLRFSPKGQCALHFVDFEKETDFPGVPTSESNYVLTSSQVEKLIQILVKRGVE